MNKLHTPQISDPGIVLDETASLCDVCLKRAPAKTIQKGDDVFLHKTCKEHGSFTSPHVWDDIETYRFLMGFEKFQYPSRKVLFNITNQCNMNCHFCYAKANDISIKNLSLSDIKGENIDKFEYSIHLHILELEISQNSDY